MMQKLGEDWRKQWSLDLLRQSLLQCQLIVSSLNSNYDAARTLRTDEQILLLSIAEMF